MNNNAVPALAIILFAVILPCDHFSMATLLFILVMAARVCTEKTPGLGAYLDVRLQVVLGEALPVDQTNFADRLSTPPPQYPILRTSAHLDSGSAAVRYCKLYHSQSQSLSPPPPL